MANYDEGTPCSGALGGGSPRVRQATQQCVERCWRAAQYGQAFFDKIWFHGRSVLLPNTQISVTDRCANQNSAHKDPIIHCSLAVPLACWRVALDAKDRYLIGGGQLAPRRSY